MPERFKTCAIVGLGLIGGSLAAGIRRRFPRVRVIGISRTPASIQFARKKKWIHEGTSDFHSAVQKADFVILCTPVDTIPKFLGKLEREAKAGTIVTDVGSTKEVIMKAALRMKLKKIHFVGSHPLAGSHLTGIRHAKPDLFKRAHVFVTPGKPADSRTVRHVSNFWKKLGTRVHVISSKTHDQIVGEISHLPHAAASILMNSVSMSSIRFASTGFLDTTRVAAGDPALWVPIFLTNRKYLLADLKRFRSELNRFLSALQKGSGRAVLRLLGTASKKRQMRQI